MMNSRSRLVFDSGTVPHSQILLFGGGGGDPVFRGARSVVGLDEARGVKRPFFTTADDLWEEEYYDDQMPEKKRRLTAEQVLMLERSFDEENKLEPDRKNELAKKLGLQPRQIAVWFQNRRARWKTKNLEQEYDRLKSSYDALRTNHESALKENDLLQNKVHELTKLLVARGVHLDEPSHSTVMAEEATAIVDQSSPPAAQLQMGTRAEDLTSAGTTGSAVVDAEGTHRNGKSYYNVGGVQSEDDSVSDGGCNFFPDQDLIENQHFIDDVENFNFWDWGCSV